MQPAYDILTANRAHEASRYPSQMLELAKRSGSSAPRARGPDNPAQTS